MRSFTISFKLKSIVLVSLLALLNSICAQDAPSQNAFKSGEKLEYKIYYHSRLGDFYAGKATVKTASWTSNAGKSGFHFSGTGETNNFFDVFYSITDHFESFVNGEDLRPVKFIRNTSEGSRILNDTVCFDWESGVATTLNCRLDLPRETFDLVSAVYYLRTVSVKDFGPDSLFPLQIYLDDSVYNTFIKYEGRVTLETQWGSIPCLKVKPGMIVGEVFNDESPLSVWVTEDENHIPVMAESEILIGSVRMILIGFEGLKNPFAANLDKKELNSYSHLRN